MKDPAKPAERRRVPRIAVDLPVTVKWGRKQHRMQAKEFSEFGILLAPALKETELAGEEVQITLSLESSKSSLSLLGVVAYTSQAGMGIRFKNVLPEQHVILKDYARAHGIGIVRR